MDVLAVDVVPPPAIPTLPPNKKNRKQVPQTNLDDFWSAFQTKHPGKVHSIIPQNLYAKQKAASEPRGPTVSRPILESFNHAKSECIAIVDKISKDCRRINQRYRDAHFDMEFDLKWTICDCLNSLAGSSGFSPKSVKRVHQIFDHPQFYIDGASATDIRQGFDGDCWFLAGLAACIVKKNWIETVCVARDEKVGVYGFVFHRDGEWMHCVIDDKLYLTAPDYDESVAEKLNFDQLLNRADAENEYRKVYQNGSKALYFAQCANENETWLPLMEKAYAKAHGDFGAIEGGFGGEAVEDLTGGVTTELWTSDILDLDKFWSDELVKVNDEFLFGCSTGWADDFLGGQFLTDRKGIVAMHAYSIMEAREVKGVRLVKLRNPWGKSEWQGPWSDGSAEWTPEWMELLGHRFGDDGIFWISYDDLLKKYSHMDRTRLFGPEWKVSQHWTTVNVPWTADYNDVKFEITVSEKGTAIIVLSQLDDRYWRGLEGQYWFSLQLRLEKHDETGYIVRSQIPYFTNRSVSSELELEAGTYDVLIKITAERYTDKKTPEHVVREVYQSKRDKLIQVGQLYDLAHAKGTVFESEEEKKADADKEARVKEAAKKKATKKKREQYLKDWEEMKRKVERNRRNRARVAAHKKKKADRKRQLADDPDVADDEAEKKGDEDQGKEPSKASTEETQSEAVDTPDSSIKDAPTSEEAAKVEQKPEQTAQESSAQSSTQSEATAKPTVKDDALPEPEQQMEASQRPGPDPIVDASPPPPPPPPPQDVAESDNETVYSFASSVDSLLDLKEEVKDPPETKADEIKYDSDNDALANDPWNAVCVVGLKVFTDQSEVTIRVVRPKTADDEESPLDVDDPAKAASNDPLVATTQPEIPLPSVDGVLPALEIRDDKVVAKNSSADDGYAGIRSLPSRRGRY